MTSTAAPIFDELAKEFGEKAPGSSEVNAEAIPALTLHDYCDQAASGVEQAVVRVRVGADLYLDLCGHHFARNEAKFAELGYQVRDERDRLKAAAEGDEVR